MDDEDLSPSKIRFDPIQERGAVLHNYIVPNTANSGRSCASGERIYCPIPGCDGRGNATGKYRYHRSEKTCPNRDLASAFGATNAQGKASGPGVESTEDEVTSSTEIRPASGADTMNCCAPPNTPANILQMNKTRGNARAYDERGEESLPDNFLDQSMSSSSLSSDDQLAQTRFPHSRTMVPNTTNVTVREDKLKRPGKLMIVEEESSRTEVDESMNLRSSSQRQDEHEESGTDGHLPQKKKNRRRKRRRRVTFGRSKESKLEKARGRTEDEDEAGRQNEDDEEEEEEEEDGVERGVSGSGVVPEGQGQEEEGGTSEKQAENVQTGSNLQQNPNLSKGIEEEGVEVEEEILILEPETHNKGVADGGGDWLGKRSSKKSGTGISPPEGSISNAVDHQPEQNGRMLEPSTSTRPICATRGEGKSAGSGLGPQHSSAHSSVNFFGSSNFLLDQHRLMTEATRRSDSTFKDFKTLLQFRTRLVIARLLPLEEFLKDLPSKVVEKVQDFYDGLKWAILDEKEEGEGSGVDGGRGEELNDGGHPEDVDEEGKEGSSSSGVVLRMGETWEEELDDFESE